MQNLIKEINYKGYMIRSNTNYDLSGNQKGYIIIDPSGHDLAGQSFSTIKFCKEVIDNQIDFEKEYSI